MNKRRFFLLAGLVALGLVVAFNFGYIHQFIGLIHEVRWYVFPLILLIQGLDYYANAKYYRSIFEIMGYDLPIRKLYEVALAINFVNQAFPSGGVSGTSFLSHALGEEVPNGKATLAQFGRYVFTYISFMIVLSVGFVFLILGNNVAHVSVRLMLLVLLGLLILSVIALTLINERSKLEDFVSYLAKWLNRGWRKVFRRKQPLVKHVSLKAFFDEFYEGYHYLMQKKGQWYRPLLYCLAANFAEVATVYVVFLAFGVLINPGVVIAGYTIANIISVISIFSSGAGLYEATMIGSFAALGVPFALSFSVVIVYRMLNFVLFLPLGFRYYRKYV